MLLTSGAPLALGRVSGRTYREGNASSDSPSQVSNSPSQGSCSPGLLSWSHPLEGFWLLYPKSNFALPVRAPNILSISSKLNLDNRYQEPKITWKSNDSGSLLATSALPLLMSILPAYFPISFVRFHLLFCEGANTAIASTLNCLFIKQTLNSVLPLCGIQRWWMWFCFQEVSELVEMQMYRTGFSNKGWCGCTHCVGTWIKGSVICLRELRKFLCGNKLEDWGITRDSLGR